MFQATDGVHWHELVTWKIMLLRSPNSWGILPLFGSLILVFVGGDRDFQAPFPEPDITHVHVVPLLR